MDDAAALIERYNDAWNAHDLASVLQGEDVDAVPFERPAVAAGARRPLGDVLADRVALGGLLARKDVYSAAHRPRALDPG